MAASSILKMFFLEIDQYNSVVIVFLLMSHIDDFTDLKKCSKWRGFL